MYKYKSNNSKLTCCPMGTLRDSSVVECYWFGVVTLKECSECKVRKDKKIVKKGGLNKYGI